MKDMLSIKISKKELNQAFRMLATGFNSHKKNADQYRMAFSIRSSDSVTASVPGGEYILKADTEGSGSFSVNYRWMRMFVRSCKAKTLEISVTDGVMTINQSNSVRVRQSIQDLRVPLSLTYSTGELVRMDVSGMGEETLDFWGLHKQIQDARAEISDVIDDVYLRLVRYLPPKLSERKCKELLSHDILLLSEVDWDHGSVLSSERRK